MGFFWVGAFGRMVYIDGLIVGWLLHSAFSLEGLLSGGFFEHELFFGGFLSEGLC